MTGAVIGVSFRMAFAGAMADGRPGLALVELSVVEQRLDAVRAVLDGADVVEVAVAEMRREHPRWGSRRIRLEMLRKPGP